MINRLIHNIFPLLCIVFLLIGLILVFINIAPIQVLRNFTITTDKKVYKVGQTMQVTSKAIKLRKAGGDVHRTIECDSSGNRIIGYTINTQEAISKPGKSSKPYNIVIPTSIANLPVTCRLVVSVNYHIFTIGRVSLRNITEYTVSNDFMVR